jgi:hypothetical protein
MIEAQSNNEIVKQYDKLISDLSKDKLDTRKFFQSVLRK